MGVTEEGEQGIWGKCKTVADPEAAKATKDAQAQNEDAFDNLEKSKDKKGLVDTAEYKEFHRHWSGKLMRICHLPI